MPGYTKLSIISGTKHSGVRGAYVPANLTADSVPDLDNWGPDDYWSCEAFVAWYTLMKQKYGYTVAKARFLSAYANAVGAFSYHETCRYDSNFRNFFAGEGIDVDSVFSSIIMPVIDSAGNVIDVVQNATEGASEASEGVKKVGTVVKWVLPVAALIGGAWAVDKYVYPIFPRSKKRK